MKIIPFFRNITIVIVVCLVVLQVRFVLPEYLACKNAFEGEYITTFWGDAMQCHGESMDVTSSYYQLLNGCIIVLFFLLIFWQILLKKR